jgi:predicted RNA-binding protein associated with RNAse of E/G family
MAYSKWDGSSHWHFEVQELGHDQHGHWFSGAPGILLQRAEEPPTEEVNGFVMLVPQLGSWIAFWNRVGEVTTYIDVTDLPRIVDGTIQAVDLDLDVIAWRDGRVEVVDRDEFEEHQELLGYPADVVVGAEQTAAWLETEVRGGRAPFDGVAQDWLDRAVAAWGRLTDRSGADKG